MGGRERVWCLKLLEVALWTGRLESQNLNFYNLSAGCWAAQSAGIPVRLSGLHRPVPTKKIIGNAL